MAHINHEKLTKVEDSTLPEFKLQLRMPGWKPDFIQRVTDVGAPIGSNNALYIEEVLRAVATNDPEKPIRIPFQPPLHEPAGSDWILGGPLYDPDPHNPFSVWIHELSVRARNYNASLYRLRRQHLLYEANTIEMEILANDKGEWPPEDAEDDFVKNAKRLREITNPTRANNNLDSAIVDFVQVNGYIVSIRAVANIFATRVLNRDGSEAHILFPQPGGSESSHWSLSSAFSSYSSRVAATQQKQEAGSKSDSQAARRERAPKQPPVQKAKRMSGNRRKTKA